MTKKRSKHKRSRHHRNKKENGGNIRRTWVDGIVFNDSEDDFLSDDERRKIDKDKRFGVISWNVLAQSYASPISHRHLPKRYQSVVFNPGKRQEVLISVLRKITEESSIICLQEVDMHELVETTLGKEEFEGVSTPTVKGGGSGGRVDSCCIYWKHQEWEILDQELVRFDDLATLTEFGKSDKDEIFEFGKQNGKSTKSLLNSNLEGVTVSFLRRNMGIMVKLKSRINPFKTIVVANAHLYWNPQYDYVKLCQAHYFAIRCKSFSRIGVKESHPIIFCGDLNSKPHGAVHTYLTQGRVNAKFFAPWYHNQDEGELEFTEDGESKTQIIGDIGLIQGSYNASSIPKIRYILDFTLSKLCRWLRILGIDAALETEGEEIERTKNANLVIFQRCKKESRTLITKSSKLLQRRDCPPGTYLVNPRAQTDLEVAFVHLIKSHGVVLEPQTFLTRCVICNGNIRRVDELEKQQSVLAAHDAPLNLVKDRSFTCFQCQGCRQGFWWCDSPTSSSSRVKDQATKLFTMCLRAGIPIQGQLKMFDFVDVEKERKNASELGINLEKSVQIFHWLKQTNLKCPLQLESSYALLDDNNDIIGECKPFTNVTHNFVGFLDYVFYDKQKLDLTARLHLPGSFTELNEKNEINGHVLPSDIWPSDHLAVGAQFSHIYSTSEENIEESKLLPLGSITMEDAFKMMTINKTTNPHNPSCDCGCVTPVPPCMKWRKKGRKTEV